MSNIKRSGTIQKVLPFVGNTLIKVLIGQRRVGKSYLLKQLMEEVRERNGEVKILYINKEDFAFDSIRSYSDFILYVEKAVDSGSPAAIFIDEIQEIREFERALRHFQTLGNYDIYCTGSNATLLSGELATLLAGRYIQIRVHSLSYSEFLEFHRCDDSNESLFRYIKRGGMPHLINLKDDDDVVIEYLRNVFDSIVLRDVVARYNIRNLRFLNDLILFLAGNTGSIVSAKKISDYLKSQQLPVLPRLVQEYLSSLENVMFVHRARRHDVEDKKVFEIGDKFYFEDLGLRHCIVPFASKDISKVLENLVYRHLIDLGYSVYVGKLDTREIDFVAYRNNSTVYIQVAYVISDDETHKREFGYLLLVNDNHRKMVVSMDEFADGNFKGIEHWHIRKFLLHFS